MGGVCSTSTPQTTTDPPIAPCSVSGANSHGERTFECPHVGAVYDVCRGPGSSFFSCGEDRRLVAHSSRSGRRTIAPWASGHDGLITRVSYSEVTNALASASRDRCVKLWRLGEVDSASQAHECSGTLAGHELTVSAVHWRTDGDLVASGSRDATVRVWDAATLKSVMRVHRPQNLVTCLRWHPTESVIVQGGEDLRVRLWDTRSGKEAQILEGYTYFPVRGQRHLTCHITHSYTLQPRAFPSAS
jgi:WD40 repeat protein